MNADATDTLEMPLPNNIADSVVSEKVQEIEFRMPGGTIGYTLTCPLWKIKLEFGSGHK